jgi:hypothetical protein
MAPPKQVVQVRVGKRGKKRKASRSGKPKKKKGGIGRLIGSGLTLGASTVANSLLPGSGSLVSTLGQKIMDALGLDEKVAIPKEIVEGASPNLLAGGEIIASASAPVAFGRDQAPTAFVNILHRNANGDVVVHVKEFLADVTTASSTNTQSGGFFDLNPTDVTDTPLLASLGNSFQHFKWLAGRLHYVHYAPTSVQARVLLTEVDDIGFFNGSQDFASLVRNEDVAIGSAYEDFSLEFVPDESLNWYACAKTGSARYAGDPSTCVQGVVSWVCDQNSATNIPIGSVYLESIVVLRKTRDPDYTFTTLSNVSRVDRDLARQLFDLQLDGKLTKERLAFESRKLGLGNLHKLVPSSSPSPQNLPGTTVVPAASSVPIWRGAT